MPAIAILLTLFFSFLLIVLPIWTFIRAKAAQDLGRRLQAEVLELQRQLARLGATVHDLKSRQGEVPTPIAASVALAPHPPVVAPPVLPTWVAPAPAETTETERLPTVPAPAAEDEIDVWRDAPPVALARDAPDPVEPIQTQTQAPVAEVASAPLINWELFMGVKLAAWIGGLALFLAVAFFVKYSFEHNLIPPEVRVAIGFVVGAGLVVGGLKLANKRYAVTAQTLCASGVVSLYAVTFVSHAVYHFPLFDAVVTFALMALVTATAFLLAVRMEAKVVAVLGILGGFITPALLGTGVDNPVGLFGYLALLDVGLIAVALHRQ